eukprot:UN02155
MTDDDDNTGNNNNNGSSSSSSSEDDDDDDEYHQVIDYSKIIVPNPFDQPLPCQMAPARNHIQTSDTMALRNPLLDVTFDEWAFFKQCPTKLKLLRSQLEQIEADIQAIPPPPPRAPKLIKPSSIIVTPLDISTYKRNLKSSAYRHTNQQQQQQQQQDQQQMDDNKENLNNINNSSNNAQTQQQQTK